MTEGEKLKLDIENKGRREDDNASSSCLFLSSSFKKRKGENKKAKRKCDMMG